jgi:hypothetical protein
MRNALRILAAVALLLALSAVPAAAKPPGPNGQIAFGRYDPFFDDTVPYTINPDGTHEQRVVDVPGEAPRFSPDGTQLSSCCNPEGDTHSAALIVNVDDPTDHRALPQPDPADLDAYCSTWSADAARVACETYGVSDPSLNGVYTIRSSDGGGLRRVTDARGASDQPGDYSPDGRRLTFVRYSDDCAGCIYVVNADGTGLHRVFTPPPDAFVSSHPSWSPQGNELVFSWHATPEVHSSLWLVHSDGSGLHQIPVQVAPGQYPCGAPNADPSAGGCFDPQWSPDGTKIVFGRGDDGLGRNIYTVSTDGSGLFQVTHGDATQSNEAPDWGTHPLATG